MDVINKPIGSEGNFDLAFTGGKVILTVKHTHASGEVSILVSEDAGYFLDKLAAKIPGTVDDAIFAVLKSAIQSV